jgi:hypothetical protein
VPAGWHASRSNAVACRRGAGEEDTMPRGPTGILVIIGAIIVIFVVLRVLGIV